MSGGFVCSSFSFDLAEGCGVGGSGSGSQKGGVALEIGTDKYFDHAGANQPKNELLRPSLSFLSITCYIVFDNIFTLIKSVNYNEPISCFRVDLAPKPHTTHVAKDLYVEHEPRGKL